MPRCPNCGRETQRTEDWACQWCGYPLLSPGYKKIDKTWKEIKEGLGEEKPFEFRKPARPSEPDEDISQAVPEIKLGPRLKPVPPSRPVKEPPHVAEKLVRPEPQPVPAPQPPVEAKVEPPVVRQEAKPVIEAVPQPAVRPAPEPVARVEAMPAPAPAPQPVPEPKPEPVVEMALALTVDELLSAYMVNDVAAHEKFTNKLLRVTGVVGKVVVNDMRAVYSVFLASNEIAGFRDVECRFSRQYASLISQLKPGQSVTVQGRYFGYVINIILRNCDLVQ